MQALTSIIAFLQSPLGQAVLGVALFLIAKRFPAFQGLIWSLLDALKVPRPNVPPGPPPVPGPGPGPDPSPVVPSPSLDLGSLLSALLARLLAAKQHDAAKSLVELAAKLEPEVPSA